MPLRFIAGRILRELIGVLALSMMALPGVAVAAADVRESLGEPTSPRFDAVRRHRQPAEVLGVFFALRLVLVLPGVSRRSFVDDVLDGLSDANEGEPGLAVTTTSVTLSLPRLNCTQVHRLPPLAEHAGFRLQLTPDLVGCPTVLERVRPVAAARTCAPDLRRAWQGPAGAKVAPRCRADPRRDRRRPGSGAGGFRTARIGRIGRSAADPETFARRAVLKLPL